MPQCADNDAMDLALAGELALIPDPTCLLRLVLLLFGAYCLAPGNPTYAASTQGISFSGRILQKGRRDPIEGAGIFVRELRRGAYTDAKGRFVLKLPPGRYTIIIKAIGFDGLRQTHTLRDDKSHTFYLSVDPKQELQTTVKAKRNQYTPGQVAISRKEIREMAGGLGGDPFRVLQNLPGVARSLGLSGSLRIRGASPTDTGFAMDGHKLPLLYHFGGGPAVVNDRFIEKIDFFPGGAPVNFGRFTAGLVSVHSRAPTDKGFHGEVFLDIIHAGLYLEYAPSKHWHIALAARRSYVDAFIGLFTTDSLAARYWDYQLKVTWRSGHHRLSLFVFGSDDLVDYEGQKNSNDLPFLDADPIYLAIGFARAILQYRYQRSIVEIRLSAAAGFNQTTLKELERNGSIWEWPIELRGELRLRLHKRLRVDVGFDGGWQRQLFDFTIPVGEFIAFPRPSGSRSFSVSGKGEKDLVYPGAYLNAHWRPHKQIQIDAGLRFDLFALQDRVFWGLDPRVSFRWQFRKPWRFLFSSGLFHRPPDLQQWSIEIGNPDLGLQTALQIAAGLEYQPFAALNIRVQGFFNYAFDRIVGSSRVIEQDGKLVREQFNNEGLGRGYGLEVMIRLRKWHGLSGWLAYTLSRAERGTNSAGINQLYNYDQTHILNLLVQYEIGKGWKVGARFRLVSGRPYTPVIGGVFDADTDRYQPRYGERDSARFPTFHQLDLRVDKEWTFNTWKLGIYLDLMNVYNAQPTERYRYQYDFKDKFPVPGLPFIPALGLKGEF